MKTTSLENGVTQIEDLSDLRSPSESGIAPEYLNQGFKHLLGLMELPASELMEKVNELDQYLDSEGNCIIPAEYSHNDYGMKWVIPESEKHIHTINHIVRNLQHNLWVIKNHGIDMEETEYIFKVKQQSENQIRSIINLIHGYHGTPSGLSESYVHYNFPKLNDQINEYQKNPNKEYETYWEENMPSLYSPEDYPELKSNPKTVKVVNEQASQIIEVLEDPSRLLGNNGQEVGKRVKNIVESIFKVTSPHG